MEKIKVSFDFDGTLTLPEVQEYFLELLDREELDVYIVTYRYDELHKTRYLPNPTNDDLWEIIDKLKFPREKVMFMNTECKAEYMSHTDILWHLDDDDKILYRIMKFEKQEFIDVKSGFWKAFANDLINHEIKKRKLLN